MKKQFISFICAGIVSMLTSNLSFAQDESFKELPPITISASTSNVSAKVNKSFNQYFKGASYQRWYQLDKNFLVKFIQNEQENRALFTKNGSLIYHISYGTEKHLPSNVRSLVKSNYYDQNITRVLKVNQDRRNIWVISMEDAKDIVMVRVEDMELEETQRMHKSN
ncbi:MAG: hypothetical protein ACSLE0_03515 [Chitinophagaceae bacterium]